MRCRTSAIISGRRLDRGASRPFHSVSRRIAIARSQELCRKGVISTCSPFTGLADPPADPLKGRQVRSGAGDGASAAGAGL